MSMLHIIKYTLIENLRSRIYLSSLGLLLLIAGISWIGSSINYNFGEFHLTIMSFGMNLTELLVTAVALFLPVNHLSLEFERGTSQVLWAKLKNRSRYYLGKYFSFLILIFFLLLLSCLFIAFLSILQGASFSHVLGLGYFLFAAFLEASCVLSLVFFLYAIFTAPALTSLLGILIIYSSIFLETARDIAVEAATPLIRFLYASIYYLMPRFGYFNLENQIIYREPVSPSYLFGIALYTLIFAGVLISLSNWIVEKKEF